jgi:hypothetical protein
MGIAALHPSYKSGNSKSEGTNLQIQIAQLISSSMVISDSIPTSRHVRFAFDVQSGSRWRAG